MQQISEWLRSCMVYPAKLSWSERKEHIPRDQEEHNKVQANRISTHWYAGEHVRDGDRAVPLHVTSGNGNHSNYLKLEERYYKFLTNILYARGDLEIN